MNEWYVYLLLCSNDSLYCGIAKDPRKRFQDHVNGRGARYTRMHTPKQIMYLEGPLTHGDALRRERSLKALQSRDKRALCDSAANRIGDLVHS
jgi:putative endonuclease